MLAAAGKVDEDALLRLAEGLFGDMTVGTPPPAPPARFTGGTHHDRRRFDQLHVALAFPGVGQLHADAHALSLFATAAGGGMSSRLFQEVREARGLAYSIYAWSHAYAETGMFGTYCAAARGDAAEAPGAHPARAGGNRGRAYPSGARSGPAPRPARGC